MDRITWPPLVCHRYRGMTFEVVRWYFDAVILKSTSNYKYISIGMLIIGYREGVLSTRCCLVEGPASLLPALTLVEAWSMLPHYKAKLQLLIRYVTFFENSQSHEWCCHLAEVCISYCKLLSQMEWQCSTEIHVSLSWDFLESGI